MNQPQHPSRPAAYHFLMTEIVFLVEEDPDGGFVASALGFSIITQADSFDELKIAVRDAVRCHFPDAELRISFSE